MVPLFIYASRKRGAVDLQWLVVAWRVAARGCVVARNHGGLPQNIYTVVCICAADTWRIVGPPDSAVPRG